MARERCEVTLALDGKGGMLVSSSSLALAQRPAVWTDFKAWLASGWYVTQITGNGQRDWALVMQRSTT